MKSIQSIILVALGASALVLAGCAHTAPGELVNARAACLHSNEGSAAALVPADLHIAQVALTKAERSYADDPDSFMTRDLSYVAQRKCQKVDALASIANEQGSGSKAKDEFSTVQGEIVDRTKADLSKSQADLSNSESALGQARAALMAALAKLAAVKEEPRGLVITLSGSVLFRSDESTLLPAAQTKLNEVAEALLTDPDRSLVVEGHTDSQGGTTHNQALSQRRADSVRVYLVGRGYEANDIVARGMGEGSPVADNGSSEGRSNNRRVEIIVQPTNAAQAGSAQ